MGLAMHKLVVHIGSNFLRYFDHVSRSSTIRRNVIKSDSRAHRLLTLSGHLAFSLIWIRRHACSLL